MVMLHGAWIDIVGWRSWNNNNIHHANIQLNSIAALFLDANNVPKYSKYSFLKYETTFADALSFITAPFFGIK